MTKILNPLLEALWTQEQSIKILIEIVEDESAKTCDRLAAIKVLNNMHGYYMPEKIGHGSSDGSMALNSTIDVSKLSESTLAEILAAKV